MITLYAICIHIMSTFANDSPLFVGELYVIEYS